MEDAILAENPEVIGDGDGTSDVVVAATVPLGDAEFGARPDGVDLGLEAREKSNRASSDGLGYPGGFGVSGIPEAARTLYDGLDLCVG